MLVFFIHGVNTQNFKYADVLIKNIRKDVRTSINFYPSFLGNLFCDKKHQTVGYIEKDLARAFEKHSEYKEYHYDIYRYQQRRNDLISNFLSDFLIYQNPKRGKAIRKVILEQISQFLENHPDQTQLHFIAHSLGSFILWDLLFSNVLPDGDPAFVFRERLNCMKIESITTLGSPLLFLKQMLNIDFSLLNHSFEKNPVNNSVEL